MKWIDLNPEFALIVSSDHGGQFFEGEDNFCNHGCVRDGNQGVLFYYISEFSKNKTAYNHNKAVDIQTYDVAPIISQIIENANVPLESSGNPFPVINESKRIFNIFYFSFILIN